VTTKILVTHLIYSDRFHSILKHF